MYLLNENEEKLRLLANELLKNIFLGEPLDISKIENFLENYDSIFNSLNDRIREVEYWSNRYFERIKDFENDIYHVIETIDGDKHFHHNYSYLTEVQHKLSEIINENTEIDYHD